MKLIDITGQKFGRLTALEKLPARADGGSLWRCRCDCGNECERNSSTIRKAGSTPSCGCYMKEWSSHLGSNPSFVAKRSVTVTRHGNKRRGATSPEYKTWLRMKSRCYRKTDCDYPNWGGRGIRVCDEWRNDFQAFLDYMGPLPSPAHTIDRLESDKDYAPGNCRWATRAEQGAENRRGFVSVTVAGVTFAKIADACRHFGVSPTTVNERLNAGIPMDQAFTPGRLKSRRTRESYLRKDRR